MCVVLFMSSVLLLFCAMFGSGLFQTNIEITKEEDFTYVCCLVLNVIVCCVIVFCSFSWTLHLITNVNMYLCVFNYAFA